MSADWSRYQSPMRALGRDKNTSSPGSFSRQSSYDGWRWSSISHILSSFTKVVLLLMAIMILKRMKCLSKYFQFSIFTFCVSVTKAIINAKLPTLISIGHAQLCRSKSKYFLWRQIVSQSPSNFLDIHIISSQFNSFTFLPFFGILAVFLIAVNNMCLNYLIIETLMKKSACVESL